MDRYINAVRRKLANVTAVARSRVAGSEKVVSFTFDDVPASGFENGGGILKKHGVAGTFYVSLSYMEGQSSDHLYTRKHLEDCLANGHEIGGHTFSHTHIYEKSLKEYIADVERNREEFERLGLGTSLSHFAYPGGQQTRGAKRHVGKLYTNCRGIGHGINVGRVDANNLKAVRLYESRYPLSEIDTALANLKAGGGWLIFYTHDVQVDYSPYGCSPEYLERVVEHCLELGCVVETVGQASRRLGVGSVKIDAGSHSS